MESTFGHMPLGHLRPTGHLPLTITVEDIYYLRASRLKEKSGRYKL